MSLPQLPTRETILGLLQSPEETDRKQGIIELIRSRDPLSLNLLEKISAEDSSAEVRYFARRALASFSPPPAPPTEVTPTPSALSLLERLQSADHRLRLKTLHDIARFPLSEALPAVCRCLTDEVDPRWQSRFLSTLSRLRTPDSIDCILPFLQNQNTRVRANAAEALGSIGTREALLPLIPLLSDDDNRVKSNIIQALHGIDRRELTELLRSLAQDGRLWMRDSALYALSRLCFPEARGIIEEVSRSDPSERLRQKAIELLSIPELGPQIGLVPATVAPIAPPFPDLDMSLWSEPNPSFRAMRLWQSFSGDNAPALEVVCAGLRQESNELSLTLLLSLIRRFPQADFFSKLVPHLDSRHSRIRAATVEALQAVNPAQALTQLYPLLEDLNNRVRANALLALSNEPLFPAMQHICSMAHDPRETWRLSSLYVLLQKPRSDSLSLLSDLLDDLSERVRDAAHQVLLRYRSEQVQGIDSLVEKVETRLRISKTPQDFFENTFDHMFSGLIRVVSAGDDQDVTAQVQPRFDSERIRKQLLELGRKALAENLLDQEFAENTVFLSDLAQSLVSAAESLAALPPPESSAELIVSVARASQAEWLRQKAARFRERHDLLMIQGGSAIARFREKLTPQTAAALDGQLQRVESLGEHLPAAATSVLPEVDAPVSEIFDLTMRLYQKHVVGISLLSIIHFGIVGVLVFLGLVVLFTTGVKPEDIGDFSEFMKGEDKAKGLLLGLWVFFSLFCAYASFKSHLIIFLREFIKGSKVSYSSMISEALDWIPQLVWLQARKFLYLFGWLFLASLAATLVESFFGPEAKKSVFLGATKDLSAAVAAALVFGYGFLAYTMAEPLAILSRPSETEDPLVQSRRLTAPWIFKISLLCGFSLLLVQFITSATQELLMLGTFFSAADRYAPLVRKSISIIAILSQLCLLPLLLANLVIFSLMLLRGARTQVRS